MKNAGKIALISLTLLSTSMTVSAQTAPPEQNPAVVEDQSAYVIGAGDQIQVFVWKNPDLSVTVPVRPDGKITTPLVQDTQAQGKTPVQLAADLTVALSRYIKDPNVSVVVRTVAAPENAAAIRIIGSAIVPKTVPYRNGLTALDVIIELGGLPVYANGNAAELIRNEGGKMKSTPLHLTDLMKGGNINANVTLKPGDIIKIPERMF